MIRRTVGSNGKVRYVGSSEEISLVKDWVEACLVTSIGEDKTKVVAPTVKMDTAVQLWILFSTAEA